MARTARNKYYLNPAVRALLDERSTNQGTFCKKAGVSDSYFSRMLKQNVSAGPVKRTGILKELALLLGRKNDVNFFHEIFSAEKHT